MTGVWDLVRPLAAIQDGRGKSMVRWAGRGLAGCLDQAAVSGASFAANVLLARWLPPGEYGAFSVAFTLFLVLAGFHNALLVDPACVLGPARFGGGLHAYFKRVVCLHGAWSVAASLTVALAALATGDASLRRAFWGLTISLPFLLLLWLLRRLCYVDRSPAAALASSAAYAPLLIGGLFLCRRWGQPSSFSALLIMAAAALAASLTVMGSLGMAHGWGGIRKEAALELARAHWLYGRWLSATSLLNLGITQLQTFLVGGLLGLEAAGAFRAMFNLVQPMNQLTAAIALLFVADFSADFGAGRSEKLRAKGALITAGLAGLSILYELILILFGARLERLLYGGRFAAYAGLIPVLGLMPVFIALGSGCSLVLQAVQKPQHYLIRGAVIGPVGICSAVVLTSWAGLGGAAASTVITLALSALVTFWLYRRFGPVGGEVHT